MVSEVLEMKQISCNFKCRETKNPPTGGFFNLIINNLLQQ